MRAKLMTMQSPFLLAFIATLVVASTAHAQQVLEIASLNDNIVGEYNANFGATINASLVAWLSLPRLIAISGGNLFIATVVMARSASTRRLSQEVYEKFALCGSAGFVSQLNAVRTSRCRPCEKRLDERHILPKKFCIVVSAAA